MNRHDGQQQQQQQQPSSSSAASSSSSSCPGRGGGGEAATLATTTTMMEDDKNENDATNVVDTNNPVHVLAAQFGMTPEETGYIISVVQQTNPSLESLKQPKVQEIVKQRKGRWVQEEEDFANFLSNEFGLGLSSIDNGTTKRAYLSSKLQCTKMRISKKFRGKNTGKEVFLSRRRRQNGMTGGGAALMGGGGGGGGGGKDGDLSPREMLYYEQTHEELERRFLKAVLKSVVNCGVKNALRRKPRPTTMASHPPPVLQPAVRHDSMQQQQQQQPNASSFPARASSGEGVSPANGGGIIGTNSTNIAQNSGLRTVVPMPPQNAHGIIGSNNSIGIAQNSSLLTTPNVVQHGNMRAGHDGQRQLEQHNAIGGVAQKADVRGAPVLHPPVSQDAHRNSMLGGHGGRLNPGGSGGGTVGVVVAQNAVTRTHMPPPPPSQRNVHPNNMPGHLQIGPNAIGVTQNVGVRTPTPSQNVHQNNTLGHGQLNPNANGGVTRNAVAQTPMPPRGPRQNAYHMLGHRQLSPNNAIIGNTIGGAAQPTVAQTPTPLHNALSTIGHGQLNPSTQQLMQSAFAPFASGAGAGAQMSALLAATSRPPSAGMQSHRDATANINNMLFRPNQANGIPAANAQTVAAATHTQVCANQLNPMVAQMNMQAANGIDVQVQGFDRNVVMSDTPRNDGNGQAVATAVLPANYQAPMLANVTQTMCGPNGHLSYFDGQNNGNFVPDALPDGPKKRQITELLSSLGCSFPPQPDAGQRKRFKPADDARCGPSHDASHAVSASPSEPSSNDESEATAPSLIEATATHSNSMPKSGDATSSADNDIPDLLSGFDEHVASMQQKNATAVAAVVVPQATTHAATLVSRPAPIPENSHFFAGADVVGESPYITSKSFDDLHKFLGEGLSSHNMTNLDLNQGQAAAAANNNAGTYSGSTAAAANKTQGHIGLPPIMGEFAHPQITAPLSARPPHPNFAVYHHVHQRPSTSSDLTASD